MNVFRFFSKLSAYQNKYVGMLAHLCTVCIRVSLLRAPTHYHFESSERSTWKGLIFLAG